MGGGGVDGSNDLLVAFAWRLLLHVDFLGPPRYVPLYFPTSQGSLVILGLGWIGVYAPPQALHGIRAGPGRAAMALQVRTWGGVTVSKGVVREFAVLVIWCVGWWDSAVVGLLSLLGPRGLGGANLGPPPPNGDLCVCWLRQAQHKGHVPPEQCFGTPALSCNRCAAPAKLPI